jgi:alpha-galactosidase
MGIYSDVGYKTCQNFPGSYDNYEIDAQTYADWGIDFLKLDFCNTNPDIEATPWKYYERMSVALNKTGRPIVYSICNWGVKNPWEWAPAMSNSKIITCTNMIVWRTTGDSQVLFERILQILDDQRPLYKYAGESAWNDPDMLLAGVNNTDQHGKPAYLTIEQSRAQYSIWCILSAPLLLSNDLRKLGQPDNKWLLDMITNEEVIAVDQDVLKIQGQLIANFSSGNVTKDGYCSSSVCTRTETWAKRITNNKDTFAAVLFNRAGHADDKKFNQERMRLSYSLLGNYTASTRFMVRDLWKRKNLGVYTGSFISDYIAPQDVQMISLTPV